MICAGIPDNIEAVEFFDQPLANAYFETIEGLDKAFGERCSRSWTSATSCGTALFHLWPR